MKHPTETVKGNEYPAPGKWSVAWVEGDGIRFRYDPDGDRIHDGRAAQLWVNQDKSNPFDTGTHILQVDGDEVARIGEDDVMSREHLFEKVGDLLVEHTPDE